MFVSRCLRDVLTFQNHVDNRFSTAVTLRGLFESFLTPTLELINQYTVKADPFLRCFHF